jgi:hypothetical protein
VKHILARLMILSVGIWWLTAPPRSGDSPLAQWVLIDFGPTVGVFTTGHACNRALDAIRADPALNKKLNATECLSSEDPRIVRDGQVEILTPPGR